MSYNRRMGCYFLLVVAEALLVFSRTASAAVFPGIAGGKARLGGSGGRVEASSYGMLPRPVAKEGYLINLMTGGNTGSSPYWLRRRRLIPSRCYSSQQRLAYSQVDSSNKWHVDHGCPEDLRRRRSPCHEYPRHSSLRNGPCYTTLLRPSVPPPRRTKVQVAAADDAGDRSMMNAAYDLAAASSALHHGRRIRLARRRTAVAASSLLSFFPALPMYNRKKPTCRPPSLHPPLPSKPVYTSLRAQRYNRDAEGKDSMGKDKERTPRYRRAQNGDGDKARAGRSSRRGSMLSPPSSGRLVRGGSVRSSIALSIRRIRSTLHNCAKADDAAGAWNALARLENITTPLPLDYNVLIALVAKLHPEGGPRADRDVDLLLDRMAAKGVAKDGYTYGSLIKAARKNAPRALALFKEAAAAAAAEDASSSLNHSNTSQQQRAVRPFSTSVLYSLVLKSFAEAGLPWDDTRPRRYNDDDDDDDNEDDRRENVDNSSSSLSSSSLPFTCLKSAIKAKLNIPCDEDVKERSRDDGDGDDDDSMQYLPPQDRTKGHSSLLSVLSQMGRWQDVIDAYEYLKSEDSMEKEETHHSITNDPVSCSCVATSHASLGDLEAALRAARAGARGVLGIRKMMKARDECLLDDGEGGDGPNLLGGEEADGCREVVKSTRGMETEGPAFEIEFAYDCAIRAFGKAREWEKALSVLRMMEEEDGITPGVMSYTSTVQYLPARKATEVMEEYARRFNSSSGADAKLINVAIKAAGRSPPSFASSSSSNWRLGLEMFDLGSRLSVRPNIVTYNTIISVLASHEKWEMALQFAEEAKKSGLTWDLHTYSGVITALSTPGRWKEALYMMESGREQGVPLSSFHVSGVLRAAARAKEWEAAVAVLNRFAGEHVREGGGRSQRRRRRPPPPLIDSIALGTCISACAFSRQWKHALALHSVVIVDSPNVLSSMPLNWREIAEKVPPALQGIRPIIQPTPMALTGAILSLWKEEGMWGDVAVPDPYYADGSLHRGLWATTRGDELGKEQGEGGGRKTLSAASTPLSDNIANEAEISTQGGDGSSSIRYVEEEEDDVDDDEYAEYEQGEDEESWRWRTALRLIKWGIGSAGITVDFRCFHAALLIMNEHNQWRHALDVYRAAERAKAASLSLIPLVMSSCLKAGRWEHALSVFASRFNLTYEEEERDNDAAASAPFGLEETLQVEEGAHSDINRITHHRQQQQHQHRAFRYIGADTLALGLRALTMGGAWDKAFQLLQTQIIGQSNLLTRVDNYTDTTKIHHRKRANPEFGLSPRAFAEGIRGLPVSQWQRALYVATKQMQNAGYRRSAQVYAALIDAVGTAKGGTFVEDVVSRMQREKVAMAPHTYAAAIRAMAKSQRWESAIGLYHQAMDQFNNKGAAADKSNEIKAKNDNEGDVSSKMKMMISGTMQAPLCAVLWACHETMRYEEGVALFRSLPDGIVPGRMAFRLGMRVFAGAAAAAERRGDWQRAMWLLQQEGMSSSPGMIGGAIRAMARNGQWERAEQLYRSMLLASNTTSVPIIDDDQEASSSSSSSPPPLSSSRQPSLPSRGVLTAVASALSDAGKDERLIEFLREIKLLRQQTNQDQLSRISPNKQSQSGSSSSSSNGSSIEPETSTIAPITREAREATTATGLSPPLLDPRATELRTKLSRLIEYGVASAEEDLESLFLHAKPMQANTLKDEGEEESSSAKDENETDRRSNRNLKSSRELGSSKKKMNPNNDNDDTDVMDVLEGFM